MILDVGVATVAGLAAALLVALLLVAVGVTHTLRRRRADGALRRRAELRPLVLALLAGDPDGAEPAPDVVGAPAELDTVVLELLPSLRGADRAVLQRVLAERGVVARAAADLTARAAWRRGRAAALLGATSGSHHTAALTLLLGDRSLAVRCAATRSLGKSGDPSAVPPLLSALTAARPLPHGVVGMALLDIGTPALPALREAARCGSPEAQALVIELLGVHGDLVAAGVLESVLADRERSTVVRRAAAVALGRIGSPRPADTLSRVLAHSVAPDLRSATAEALGRIGDPAALPALTAGLTAPEGEVRAACADALVALGAEGREWLGTLAGGAGPAADAARAALDAAPPRREAVRA